MKAIAALLLLLSLVVGCEKRDPVTAKLQSITLGASKAEVERLLGKPSIVQTPTNHVGSTWLAGVEETWDYWVGGDGQTKQGREGEEKGEVCFDASGRVRYVFAGNTYRLGL